MEKYIEKNSFILSRGDTRPFVTFLVFGLNRTSHTVWKKYDTEYGMEYPDFDLGLESGWEVHTVLLPII